MDSVYEPMPYGRVLIVDDVESNLFVSTRLMELYKLQTETVMSGYEAVEKVESGKTYDIIFMDHLMPGMDGIETTGQIRGFGYTLPIVALTASGDSVEPQLFLDSGFDGFIPKPIEISLLDKTLKKYIKRDAPDKAGTPEAGAADRTAGGSALLIRSFIRDAKKAVQTLAGLPDYGALSGEDLKNYTICIHGLRSGLSNIGETTLSETAQKLEQAGRDDNKSMMAGETPLFAGKLRNLIIRLATQEEAPQSRGEAASGDSALLNRELTALIEACADYSIKTMKTILAELNNKAWPRQVRKQLDDLADHLLSGDFHEVALSAKKMIQEETDRGGI